MPILKNKSKQNTYKIIGIPVLYDDFEFISLISCAQGITKTALLRPLIQELKKAYNESNLIPSIVNNIKVQLVLEKEKKKFSIDKFKSDLKKEFIKKGISNTIVCKILKEIN